nr:DUF2508 family protein [Cohnella lubricantis]
MSEEGVAVPLIGRRKTKAVLNVEKMRIVQEIRDTERECAAARSRFEEAVETEQVDYAIYSLEAAEKKLDILLRKAKLMWSKLDHDEEEDWRIFM